MSYVVWLEQRVSRQRVVLTDQLNHNALCEFAWLRAGVDIKRHNDLLAFEVCQPLREGIADMAAHPAYYNGIKVAGSCRELSSCLSYLREVVRAAQAFPLAAFMVRQVSDTGRVLRNRSVPERQMKRNAESYDPPCSHDEASPPTDLGRAVS